MGAYCATLRCFEGVVREVSDEVPDAAKRLIKLNDEGLYWKVSGNGG